MHAQVSKTVRDVRNCYYLARTSALMNIKTINVWYGFSPCKSNFRIPRIFLALHVIVFGRNPLLSTDCFYRNFKSEVFGGNSHLKENINLNVSYQSDYYSLIELSHHLDWENFPLRERFDSKTIYSGWLIWIQRSVWVLCRVYISVQYTLMFTIVYQWLTYALSMDNLIYR